MSGRTVSGLDTEYTVQSLSGSDWTYAEKNGLGGKVKVSTLATVVSSLLSLGTMATQNANAVAITGGAIDGTVIGGTTRAAVNGTTGNFNSTLTVSGHLTVEGVTSTGATGTGKFVFDTAPTVTTLTVSSGGAAITGNTTITGTLSATGNTTLGTALAASFLVAGNAAGFPGITATSTGASTNFLFGLKGTADFSFQTGTSDVTASGTQQFRIVGAASADDYIVVGGSNGGNAYIKSGTRNLLIGTGSAIATNATTGMLAIPGCAGAPTGAPTGAGLGAVILVYDTTDEKLYRHNGTNWKSVTFA